jgi:ubiquitin-associated and SH3 domain-containing protein
MRKKFEAIPQKSLQSQGLLRFFFVRHGERIDLAFGPQWIEQAYDRNGKYRRINLNMPQDLPHRGNKREFLGDSPLTEIGQFQAKLSGEALGMEGYKIHYCYVSPALRCIQTAHQILSGKIKLKINLFIFNKINNFFKIRTAQGLEKIVKIRIEPSIFEFLGWYDKGLPTFLSTEALINFGYNIDVNYRQLLPVERLQSGIKMKISQTYRINCELMFFFI